MFSKLSIDRFRGFKHLRVEPLDRFNLFLGQNNVGKTALLESIFLLVGPTNPELSLRLSGLRGIEQFKNDPEDIWGWLFYGKKIDTDILLRADLANGTNRSLKIELKERKEIRFETNSKRTIEVNRRSVGTTSTAGEPSELVIDYRDEHKRRSTSKAFINETGIGFERGKSILLPTSIFISPRGGNNPDNAERYSKLEETGGEAELFPALRVLEPRLTRLAVLVTGGVPILHCDVGIGRMIPLPLMGEGLGRLLTLLLSITASKGGVVMIDEIETGLHYSAMTKIWTAVAKAARTADVQIFATTHSFECLRAAYDSFSEYSFYDFQMHRLERKGDQVEAIHYDRDMIQTAINSGLEMR